MAKSPFGEGKVILRTQSLIMALIVSFGFVMLHIPLFICIFITLSLFGLLYHICFVSM